MIIQGKYVENNRDIGYKAEKIASDFLESLGYTIIQKNFHFGRYGEIDIICSDNTTLVFVEVKYRNTYNYGTPESSITHKKIKTLRRAAEGFLYIRKIVDTECRFDIIAIDFTDGMQSIRHLKCAF